MNAFRRKLVGLALTTFVLIGCSGNSDRNSDSAPERAGVVVRTAQVTVGTVQSWVFAEGTARSVRREYLSFENPGRVDFVLKSEDGEDIREGVAVRAGELLARQDQRRVMADVQSARAATAEAETQVAVAVSEIGRAEAELELAKKTLARFATLLAQKSASRQEFDEAKVKQTVAAAAVSQASDRLGAAEAQVVSAQARTRQSDLTLEETELRSPIDGILAYVNVEEGFYFTPSLIRTDDEDAALQTVPMVVIDPTAFEITANVPSFLRGSIRPGQGAVLASHSGSRPQDLAPTDGLSVAADGPIRGSVFSVNPAVSPGGRAIQVKVRVTEGAELLDDGLFVSVWIAAEKRDDVLIVPVDALVYQDNQPSVYVVKNGLVEKREVALGLQEFMAHEVVAGLVDGDRVVTDGRFQLSEGARVRVLDGLDAGGAE